MDGERERTADEILETLLAEAKERLDVMLAALFQAAWYVLKVPFARVLVLVLALTHAVGLADLIVDDACEQACNDDGCGKDCIPGDACRCHCPSAMPVLGAHTPVVAKLEPPPVMAPFAVDQRQHASPDPREILHVPRHAV